MTQTTSASPVTKFARLVWGIRDRPLSSELTHSQRNQVFSYFDAGSRRLQAARQLFGSGATVPALVLFNEAALLLMKARLIAVDSSLDVARLDSASVRNQFVDSLEETEKKTGLQLRDVLGNLESIDRMAPDRLPSGEAAELAEELCGLTRKLQELAEPQTRRELNAIRNARFAVLVTLLTLGVVGALAISLRPTNIAFHKKATASGTAPLASPAAAVDGRAYGSDCWFKSEGPSPWLMIDLGRKYAITEADIYGRHECCYDDSVPLAFEISDDGTTFREVAKREVPFEMLEAWNIKFTPVTVARYVRLHTLRDSVLYLNEVELKGWAVD